LYLVILKDLGDDDIALGLHLEVKICDDRFRLKTISESDGKTAQPELCPMCNVHGWQLYLVNSVRLSEAWSGVNWVDLMAAQVYQNDSRHDALDGV